MDIIKRGYIWSYVKYHKQYEQRTNGNNFDVMTVEINGYCVKHCFAMRFMKTQKYSFFKCLLRHDVVRVFVLFCVLVFVRAILSWYP